MCVCVCVWWGGGGGGGGFWVFGGVRPLEEESRRWSHTISEGPGLSVEGGIPGEKQVWWEVGGGVGWCWVFGG